MQPDGSRLVIVPRTGPPVTVGVDELGSERGGLQVAGWWRAVDGAERFVVVIYPPDGSSPTYVSVGVGGDVVPLVVPRAVSAGLGLSTPDGTWIVNDAGGAYEVDPSGTSRRIDNGVVQAAARDHRVVRECDDSLRCSTVLVRISDGQRRVVDPVLLPADFDAMSYGMSLSPDGSAVSIVRSGPTQERVIIDLDAGEVAGAPTGYWPQGSTWAADSSGIFDVATDGPGLQFIARTGETVAFGEELGQVIALGVRWPDAEVDPERHGRVGARQRRPPDRPDGHHLGRGDGERWDDLHRHRRRRRPELGDHGATRTRCDADQVRRCDPRVRGRPTNRRSRSDKGPRNRSTRSSRPMA